MSDVLLIIAGFALCAIPVGIVGLVVQIVRHKSKKVWLISTIALFFLFIVFEVIGIALKCNHSYTLVEEKVATCLEKGEQYFVCDLCGKEKVKKSPKLGHAMIEISTTEPSTTEEGYVITQCLRCEYQETMVLAIIQEENIASSDTENSSVLESSDVNSESTNSQDVSLTDDSSWDEDSSVMESSDISDTANTESIDVRFKLGYIDGNHLMLTVFIKNNSERIFMGDIALEFFTSDGSEHLGGDIIIVDELLPGRESWADITINAYRGTPKMEVYFWNESFTSVDSTDTEVDSEKTAGVKENYKWNFEGVSWYDDIISIVVYKDGGCEIVLRQDFKNEAISYGAVIWSCGSDYDVEYVHVIDTEGKILAVYQK